MIKIVLAGPRGKMGQQVVNMIHNHENFKLIGVIDSKNNGMYLHEVIETNIKDVTVYENCEEALTTLKPDVFVDFTNPTTGKIHTEIALRLGVKSVIGTSGFNSSDVERLQEIASKNQTGCIIAPNFALGAVLMMKFSQMAAKFYNEAEIIELHHNQKKDAPSGTAIKTAEMISQEWKSEIPTIHSVRLPGLIAHQEVLFGGQGETLKIRHDSLDRNSFMKGVAISINTVQQLDSLVYGLENILF
ncbi:MAG: 4-hydroxy-tetrahydrodipicolinate reductase [Bacillales bacterium]|jgi:4-hydroxy-tetrahydrodipicolinate reductase|nr:4-hydroxy-tetrahydrodipicolinate reductase [Bacillales bacterium]